MDAEDYRALVAEVVAEQAKRSTSAWFFTGEDRLRVSSFNSLAGVELAIEGRYLDARGRPQSFGERHVPATDRTLAQTTFPMGEGFLLGFSVRASAATPRFAQSYVIVEIVRGQTGAVTPLGVLVKGYVTDTSPLVWPGTPSRHSTEGPGVIRSITGTDPAAGADWSETVPTNARWRLWSVSASLVTAVAAANREAALVLDDGTTVVFRSPTRQNQVASLTRIYAWFAGALHTAPVQDTALTAPLGPTPLQGGYRVRVITTNLQGADDWGAPQLLVEEWIED